MTKQEEKCVIEKFRRLYKNFPPGDLHHIDRPDFLVEHRSKKVGIELTQIVHNERAKKDSTSQAKFTDLVLEQLTEQLPFHFSLTVSLFPGIGVPKSLRKEIVIETVHFCVGEFKQLEDNKAAYVHHVEVNLNDAGPFVKNYLLQLGYRNLPKGVKSISIFRFDTHGSSFNSNSEAALIPNFTKQILEKTLVKKECKLLTYKPCDEYWLIIWQGGGITGYFKTIEFHTPIRTKFDKVFLLKEFENEILILKS